MFEKFRIGNGSKELSRLPKKRHDFELMVFVMYVSFTFASIISAAINLTMFVQLSSVLWEKAIYIATSITLELTKIYCLIRANTLRSIATKIRMRDLLEAGLSPEKPQGFWQRFWPKGNNKAARGARRFYALYACFAALAILASLGLSLVITNRAAASTDAGVAKVQIDIDAANDAIAKAKKDIIDSKYGELLTAWETALSDDATLAVSQSDAQAKYDLSGKKDTTILAEINRIKSQRAALNVKIKETRYKDASTKKAAADAIIATNTNLLPGLEKQKTDLSAIAAKEKGTGNMFALLSDALWKMQEAVLRLFILLLVAMLIELTIIITSPDAKVTRSLLFYFRNSLPDDLDVDWLIAEFDKDSIRYMNRQIEVGSIKAPEQVIATLEMERPKRKSYYKPAAVREAERKAQEQSSTGSFDASDAVATAVEEAASALTDDLIPNVNTVGDGLPTIDEDLPDDVSKAPSEETSRAVSNETTPPPIEETTEDQPTPEPIFETPKMEPLPVASTVPAPVEKVVRRTAKPKAAVEPPVEAPSSPSATQLSHVTYTYRFGKTSPEACKKMEELIDALFVDEGEQVTVFDLTKARSSLPHFTDKVFDMLWERFISLRVGDKPLVEEDDGTYACSFKKSFVKPYVTERLG